MATVTYAAGDLDAAAAWYAEVLGVQPYFRRPGYVEFRVGDDEDELGIIDSAFAPSGAPTGPGGAVVYWHVEDLAGALARVLARGATEYQALTDRGGGFSTASVLDPFGNILGLMHNPHHRDVGQARRGS